MDSVSSESQAYTYDSLYRLLSATVTGGPAPYSQTYAYSATTGNLINKGGQSLQYNDPNHAHAVTDMAANDYIYDANGNQTTRIVGGETRRVELVETFNLAYDAEGHLVTVTSNQSTVASFTGVYPEHRRRNGDGKRVKAVEGSKTILFVGSHYELNATTGEVTKYYMAGATTLRQAQGRPRRHIPRHGRDRRIAGGDPL